MEKPVRLTPGGFFCARLLFALPWISLAAANKLRYPPKLMMKTTCSLLAAAVLMTLAGNVSADTLIAWSSVSPIVADYNLSTTGSYFDAVNSTQQGGSYSTTVVDNMSFNQLTNVVGGIAGQDGTDGTITIHSDGGNYAGFGFSTGSAAFKAILDTSSDANNGVVTIGSALHPLTIGATYQIQLLAYYPGPYAATVNGDPSVSFPNYSGGYSTGEFVATSTSFSFTYGGIDNNAGHAGFVDDVLVRTVPEPSTYALMIGGLAFLGFCVRRKAALLK